MNVLLNIAFSGNTLSLLLGIFFLLLAIVQFFHIKNLAAKGIKTEATVKELVEIARVHGLNDYFPVLEYTTNEGVLITKKSYVGYDKKHAQQVGDKVTIVYDPDNPEAILIDQGTDKYWKLLGALILGVAFAGAGLLHLF